MHVDDHRSRRSGGITCDTSRVAITLAKQRLMTASFDYYALRYPHEGLKGGFDYETVPHITLKSIANNPDIDTIYDEDHPKIAAALSDLNAALAAAPPKPLKPSQGVRKGKPVDFAKGDTAARMGGAFRLAGGLARGRPRAFRRVSRRPPAMQRRMDQSIADHAEQETLYDKPRIDKSKLRICGPFSVEAVPAPTVLSLDEELPPQEADETVARSGETSRQAMWRDELLKTGVRGKGGAMLRFAEFETLPGLRHIHASGSVAETGERVVVSFGPEHAALEQRQVEMALTEAETLRPSPKFILFCAFTFDPEAAKDIDEVTWPGVTLLKAQMNTDLLTEDLRRKRASNESFWLMGQPDVDLRKRDDGLWEVEVNGFDYFDPKKGDLVSGGKKQIAMWSLDVDYDNRSLMPHQVFFPMADAKGGWNRLRKTVRAELDEELLEQFHGTTSLPFEAGDHGRIAVKIVDDRGIESLKIFRSRGEAMSLIINKPWERPKQHWDEGAGGKLEIKTERRPGELRSLRRADQHQACARSGAGQHDPRARGSMAHRWLARRDHRHAQATGALARSGGAAAPLLLLPARGDRDADLVDRRRGGLQAGDRGPRRWRHVAAAMQQDGDRGRQDHGDGDDHHLAGSERGDLSEAEQGFQPGRVHRGTRSDRQGASSGPPPSENSYYDEFNLCPSEALRRN